MPTHSARAQEARWLRWARLLGLGIVCGGVQIFLLLAAGLAIPPWVAGLSLHWPLVLVGVLSSCSYLVIALLEGFLASWQQRTSEAGIAAGRLVGRISVIASALAIVGGVVMMLANPLPTGGGLDPHDLRPLFAGALFLLVLLEFIWAWAVSTLGGWIGGMAGSRMAHRSNQSIPPVAHRPWLEEMLGDR